jgi:Flp pilus assembly protein TadB
MAINLVIAFFGAAGIFAAVVALSSPPRASLEDVGGLLEEEEGPLQRLERKLREADLDVTAGEFLRTSAVLGVALAAVAYLLTRTFTATALAFGVGALGYYAYLTDRRDRRRQTYQDSLVEVIGLLVEGFGAGNTLQAAFETVAEYGPDIAKKDWAEVCSKIQTGVPIREALMEMARKRRDPVLDTIVQTLIVVKQQGGRLSAALEGLEETVRERVQIRQRIRAEQSQPLWELRLVSALPFLIVPILRATAEEYIAFWQTPLGEMSLLFSWGLTVAGYYFAQRYITSITQVEESFGVEEEEGESDLQEGLPAHSSNRKQA